MRQLLVGSMGHRSAERAKLQKLPSRPSRAAISPKLR
jgi:hypothetical protein